MFPRTSAELVKNTSTVSPTTLPTVKDALDTLNAASPGTVLTTRGDLLTRGASALARLPIGASGTVLRSDGTDPAWATVATMLASLLTARGQIIRRGSSAPEALAAQTADTFLGGDGTDVTTRTAAQVLTSLGYEVGTWTPTASFATAGTSSWTYATQDGYYIKIARFVWISCLIAATPTIGTGSGNLQIGGLPFTPDIRVVLSAIPTSNSFTWPTSRTSTIALIQPSTSFVILRANGTGQAISTFGASNMTSGSGHTVEFSGAYRVA